MKKIPHSVLAACGICVFCVFAGGVLRLIEASLVLPAQLLAFLGLIAIAIETFKWGIREGYSFSGRDFGIQIQHTLRCTVMSGIMFLVSGLFAAIALQVAFELFFRR